MKKLCTFLMATLVGISAIMAISLPKENTEPVVRVTTQAYGFSLSNDPIGIFSFGITTPDQPNMLYLKEEYTASAGAFARGKYYAFIVEKDKSPKGIYSFDLKTGEGHQLSNMADAPSIFTDMTYDYTTSTMYAIADDYPATAFVKVDLTTGQHTFIKNVENKILWTLAASPDGILYTIDSSGRLYTIDKESVELTEVADLGIYPSSLQSMDFDYNTGRLYWACMNYSSCKFCEIDLDSYTLKEIGNFPYGYQVGGLFMAFTAAGAEGPYAVSNLKAVAGAEGATTATLNWKNPTTTFGGEDLSALSYVEIYRNDTLVGKKENVTPGGVSEWTDPKAPTQTNTYRLIAYNNAGEGMPAQVSVFTGKDVPGKPSNLQVEKLSTTSVKLTWEAPQTGLNGGWYDTSALTYNILRKPDNKEVATGLNETSYTEEDVTEFAGYIYEVIAVTKEGNGGVASTPIIHLGNAVNLPYSSPLDDEIDFSNWVTYDRDGNGNTWGLSQLTGRKPGAESRADNFVSSDNWLISPPLSLYKGKVYELSFKAYTAYYEGDSLKITLGKANEPEAQTIFVKDLFIKNYYGEDVVLTLPDLDEDGIYYLGFQHHTPKPNGMVIHLNDILLKEQDKGSITGVVTDGALPLENVTLTVADTIHAATNAEGKYELTKIVAGEYVLKASLLGYAESEKNITVTPLSETVADFTLTPLPEYKVKGKVSDIAGTPICGAEVGLSGYNTYNTYTNEQGIFEFPKIYKSDSYVISIRKNNYEQVEQALTVTKDTEIEGVKLAYKHLSPYKVEADPAGNLLSLNWTVPVDLEEYYYDNGEIDHPLGYELGDEYQVMGSIYRTPATIYRVKWYTCSHENKKPYLHLYIFGLDENGNPTADKLFEQKNIPTIDDQWTTFELPTPVKAPNGYLLAVSSDGNVCIGADTGDASGKIINPKTQCYSLNYQYPDGYTYFDDPKWTSRLMLRAEGEKLEKAPSSTPIAFTYDIWRFKTEDLSAPDRWTKLKTDFKDLKLSDAEWNSLPQGIYRYAVKANYPADEETSEATFSNEVYSRMYSRITINVTANSTPADANGATVTLSDGKEHIYKATVAANKVVFSEVWKTTYQLVIEKDGFKRQNETVVMDTEDEYTFSYTLQELLIPADNIDILPTEKETEWKLIWNALPNIEDGFENINDYEDFEINPAGSIGWQYIDNDNLPTYGFSKTVFPTMRSKMAAVIFNPATTEPPLGIDAYEGDRMLGFFCASEACSDDYFISPRLDFYKDFRFSFYARTYDDEYGSEHIRVGYSLTGIDLDDFIWLDEEMIDVPKVFTYYNYSIPKEAKYVVLNSQSINGFLLLVDEVFIGVDRPGSNAPEKVPATMKNYRVYLDGNKIADTEETSYLLTNLTDGKHKASVTQIYATGESDPVNVEFTVNAGSVENLVIDQVQVYLTREGKLKVKGEGKRIMLYTSTGSVLIDSEIIPEGIDISHLPEGVYVVRVIGDREEISVHKIIKK